MVTVADKGYTQVSDKVRIEPGPRRLMAVATKGLLADDVTHPLYKEGGRDAIGKIIKLGEPMTYLDFFKPEGWYVYLLASVEEGDPPKKVERYLPQGCFDTKDEALAKALSLGG